MSGFSLHRALDELPVAERAVASHRVEMVHVAQRRLGMEPRDDSRLTYRYATNQLDGDDVPSAIANELYVVDQLYKATPYGQLLEDVLRELADFVRRKYKLGWSETWEIVRFYGPTMLKLHCAKRVPARADTEERS